LRAAVFCCASLTERRAIFHSFNPSSFLHVIVGLNRGRGRQTPWQRGMCRTDRDQFFSFGSLCGKKRARARPQKSQLFENALPKIPRVFFSLSALTTSQLRQHSRVHGGAILD